VARMRLDGYRRAMQDACVEVLDSWIVESDFTGPSGYQAACKLVEKDRPTAIFAANDMVGIGVLRAAAERNVRVPAELSVIGFDDIQMSQYVYPALTTVGQSILQLGERAAEVLLRRISARGIGPVQQLIVAPTIVLRESTAPAPNAFNAFR
jgi:LacI family transcriptional regulator